MGSGFRRWAVKIILKRNWKHRVVLGRFCGKNLLLGAILQNKVGKNWRSGGCLQNLVGKSGKITPIYKIFWENHTDLQNFLGKSCFEKGKVKILFVKWRFLFQNWRFQVEKWRFQLESEDLKGRNEDLKARSEDLTLKMKIYIGFSHFIL